MLDVIALAAVAFCISSWSDGSRLIVASFCALQPCCVAVSALVRAEPFDKTHGIYALWSSFAVSLVLTFVQAMMSVRNSVTVHDLECLLTESMSLLCTGATASHACLLLLQSRSARLEYLLIALWCAVSIRLLAILGYGTLRCFLAAHFLVECYVVIVSGEEWLAPIFIPLSILLALRVDEIFR